MDGRNLSIDTKATLDAATEVESIVKAVNDNMEDLYTVINKLAEDISFDWYEKLREDWKKLYEDDVKTVAQEMLASATNLKSTAEEATKYSQA